MSSKLAFSDMIVVKVPEPAIKGKAIGTTLPLFGLLSGLKNSIPKIISRARIKMTILPATANDPISRPRSFRNSFPRNRNSIINAPEAIVACSERIVPPIFSLREIRMGIVPNTSITAKRVNVAVAASLVVKAVKSSMR